MGSKLKQLTVNDFHFVRKMIRDSYTSAKHPDYYTWMTRADKRRADRLHQAGVIQKYTNEDGMVCVYFDAAEMTAPEWIQRQFMNLSPLPHMNA